MNRNEVSWVAIRTIGVLTLWVLLNRVVSFLVFVPTFYISMRYRGPVAYSFAGEFAAASIQVAIDAVVYGGLSYYLLRKGRAIHTLIISNIPFG